MASPCSLRPDFQTRGVDDPRAWAGTRLHAPNGGSHSIACVRPRVLDWQRRPLPGLEVVNHVARLRLLLFQNASHRGFAVDFTSLTLRLAALTLARRQHTARFFAPVVHRRVGLRSTKYVSCNVSMLPRQHSGQMRSAWLPRPLRCCIQKAGCLATIWQVGFLTIVAVQPSRLLLHSLALLISCTQSLFLPTCLDGIHSLIQPSQPLASRT